MKRGLLTGLSGGLCLLAPLCVLAGEPAPTQMRFGLTPAVVVTNDQLDAREKGQRGADPLGRSTLMARFEAIPTFYVGTNLKDSQASVYLATPTRTPDFPLAAGVIKNIPDYANVEVSAFTAFDRLVWKDPYITGRERSATRVNNWGVALDASSIRFTDLALGVSYRYVSPQEDDIGEKISALKRRGKKVGYEARYALAAPGTMTATPSLGYERGFMDGKAESYNLARLGLAIRDGHEAFGYSVNLHTTRQSFGDVHPLFGKKREDWTTGFSALVTVPRTIAGQNFYFEALTGFEYRSSSIDFFDARTYFLGVGAGVAF